MKAYETVKINIKLDSAGNQLVFIYTDSINEVTNIH